MKKKFILVSIFAALAIFSCTKPEVVPAPAPVVDLEAHFEGLINGTDVEYTEDVDGYNGTSTFEQYITTTGLDTTVYFSSMESDLNTPVLKVGIGGISFDAATLNVPSLNQFTAFFSGLIDDGTGNPPVVNYSKDAKQGFLVSYTDKDGNVWLSTLYHDGELIDENNLMPIKLPVFSNLTFESDNSGDYTKFTISFGCRLYRFKKYYTLPGDATQYRDYDTIIIEDAVYNGWIKR